MTDTTFLDWLFKTAIGQGVGLTFVTTITVLLLWVFFAMTKGLIALIGAGTTAGVELIATARKELPEVWRKHDRTMEAIGNQSLSTKHVVEHLAAKADHDDENHKRTHKGIDGIKRGLKAIVPPTHHHHLDDAEGAAS